MTINADQLRLSSDLEGASGALRIAAAAVGAGLTGGGGAAIAFDTSASITTSGTWDFTGGGISVPAPSASTDAATKQYVDDSVAGISEKVKAACRVASTGDVAGTYANTGGASGNGQFTAMTDTIDGVTLVAGDRVLLKDQTPTGAENGIWVVTTLGTGADGVWDRATDFDEDAEVLSNAFCFIEEGTVNDDRGYLLTNANPIAIGGISGDALVWAQFTTGAIATDSIDPEHLNFEWRTLELLASAFSFSATRSTLTLSLAALADASVNDGAALYKNGVLDQEQVFVDTAASNEWRVLGTALSVHDDITASGDLYQLRYIVATP